MHVSVIGAGIVGVCCAAWLQRDGHRVTFVDPLDAGEAGSFGASGLLSPSACLPLALPGVWRELPGWLARADSPVRLRAAYLPRLAPWLLRYRQHARLAEVTRIAAARRSLLAPMFDCFTPLVEHAGAQALIRRAGSLYVFSSADAARRWQWAIDLGRQLGVDLRQIDRDELAALEPDLGASFRTAMLASEDGATRDPAALVKAIHAQCLADGATHLRRRATGFSRHLRTVRAVRLDDGEPLAVDAVVVSAGAGTGPLARELGAALPLAAQRSYHVTARGSSLTLRHAVIAVERRMTINPLATGVRLSGAVEFAGPRAAPDYGRAQRLLDDGRALLPQLNPNDTSRWSGLQWCLPDGLPVIGPAPDVDNAWLGFGYGLPDLGAAAASGREIASLAAGRRPRIALEPFRPQRFA